MNKIVLKKLLHLAKNIRRREASKIEKGRREDEYMLYLFYFEYN